MVNEDSFLLSFSLSQVGLIIGKKGAWIKQLCQETGARVKVMEAIPRTEERGVSCAVVALRSALAI